MFGFGEKGKIDRVVEVATTILNSSLRSNEISINNPVFLERAREDKYLVGYFLGSTTFPGKAAGLSETGAGDAAIKTVQTILQMTDMKLIRPHMAAVRAKDPITVSGLKDGQTEIMYAFKQYVEDQSILKLDKLEQHLKSYNIS